MLEFHPMQHEEAPPERIAGLLQRFRSVLQDEGMASMEEYGDMLQWGLPRKDGVWPKFHVYHPGWCSWDDRFWGTIHYHAGQISGTVLAGHLEHYTYEAEPDPDGARFHDGHAYTLTKHTHQQPAGTVYELPAMVPHWLEPKELTITYFEEAVTDEMADLVNPAEKVLDEHLWTQEDADGLMPELIELIDARISELELHV